MGLEKIKEEILQKAESAEKVILAEASMKVNEIEKKVDEKIKQMEQEASQKLDADKKSIENKENSLANMEAQKLLFETKKEIIDKAYEKAFDKIKNMGEKEREQIIKKFIELSNKEIEVDVVYVSDADKDCIDKNFTIKQLEAGGGIICETKDGTVRVDHTLSTIFQDIKENTIKETSKILFE